MESLAFLAKPPKGEPKPIYVLAGDEDFLKRQVRAALIQWVLGNAEDSFGLTEITGDRAELAAVRDELATLPFFGSRRMIVIENADPFVTNYRPQLEKYVAAPVTSGVLVLEVKTFPATTKLAKLLTETTIVCKAPGAARLPSWCVEWAKTKHGKQLTAAAAQLLVDHIGADMGVLDQEIAKLATYVGKAARIDGDDVDKLVGRSQTASVFKVFDAIGAGQAGVALGILDELFGAGEDPFRLLGAFSMQLRRLAQVARLVEQKVPFNDALDRAGVPAWPAARQGAEQQLKHLGRRRADRIFDWLLEIDLGLKGSSQLPARTLLERLIVRLASPKDEPAKAGR